MMCRKKGRSGNQPTNKQSKGGGTKYTHRQNNVGIANECHENLQVVDLAGETENNVWSLYAVKSQTNVNRISPLRISLAINEKPVSMEIDTGASVSIL